MSDIFSSPKLIEAALGYEKLGDLPRAFSLLSLAAKDSNYAKPHLARLHKKITPKVRRLHEELNEGDIRSFASDYFSAVQIQSLSPGKKESDTERYQRILREADNNLCAVQKRQKENEERRRQRENDIQAIKEHLVESPSTNRSLDSRKPITPGSMANLRDHKTVFRDYLELGIKRTLIFLGWLSVIIFFTCLFLQDLAIEFWLGLVPEFLRPIASWGILGIVVFFGGYMFVLASRGGSNARDGDDGG